MIKSYLQVLDVSSNILETLPQSIGRLASLQSLNVDHNGLFRLPEFQLKRLLSLSAVGNKISLLPNTLSECIELQTIDLSGNPLSSKAVVTVSKLPKLLKFQHDEIKKIEKKLRWAN
jgi:Leucine-rich repeat (LRR) protein